MANPTKQMTWNISPCNRVAYASLPQVMGDTWFGIKTYMLAQGYTLDGTCDGTTGAMDGPSTDRISDGTKFRTRGAASGNAQSWMVLGAADGSQTLVAYQGSGDDQVRISFSPGGLFVASGTPNQQPTATDEQVSYSGLVGSFLNSATSGDRLWSCWVSNDSKMWRVAIAKGGAWTGGLVGVESITSKVTNGPVFTPPIWGFGIPTNGSAMINGTQVGVARALVASIAKNVNLFMMSLFVGSQFLSTFLTNLQSDMQGGGGHPTVPPPTLVSNTAGALGPFGTLIDWWIERTNAPHGTVTAELAFITMTGVAGATTGQDGCLWPWNGVTPPVMT